MDQSMADKIVYWQNMHREADQILRHMKEPQTIAYYSADDHAYIVAWQLQQAFAYRQICRHRGF